MTSKINITIIGSGNVATTLGNAFNQNGITIDAIYNHNLDSAIDLAKELHCKATNIPQDLPLESDIYLIALKDDHLLSAIQSLPLKNKLIVHTSGSFNSNTLSNISERWGCFYPMQTLKKNQIIPLNNVPVFIESAIEKDKILLFSICEEISCLPIEMDSFQRQKLHVAAVCTNNFTYHLFSCIQEFCKKNNLPYSALLPLIQQTMNNINLETPFDKQTGPAKRNDNQTIQKHLETLSNDQELMDIYSLFTKQILKKQHKDEL